jgi:hypothetical protein
MEFMVPIENRKLPVPITYNDRIMLVGSCFTEHIGNSLRELKFSVMQNPHGILFDPASVCKSLVSYIQNRRYSEEDLIQLEEVWHSWEHHSRFSNMDKAEAVNSINSSQQAAHDFLKETDWIIITLGSSFIYRLSGMASLPGKGSIKKGEGVANCHRAPAQWFNKEMLEIGDTISMLDNCYHQLMQFNPKLKLIFTVSPVRHIRDGVVENNRSKARLIEAVHHMVNKFDRLYYFPAYELVIDVLRDYRFYDIDLVHPNYMATNFVMEHFIDACVETGTKELMAEVKKIVTARKHRAFQPSSNAHKNFLQINARKVKELQEKYPFLDLESEIQYFTAHA